MGLPCELILDILDFAFPCPSLYCALVSTDYSALKKCCLVSRAWSTHLQRRIFRYVELASSANRLAYLRAIKGKGERGAYLSRSTTTLVLDGNIFPKGDVRNLTDTLSECPNLEAVYVKSEMPLSYIPLGRVGPVFFRIRRFDVEMAPSSSWHTLYDILHLLPSLKYLAIRDYEGVGSMVPIDELAVFPFQLQEFILICSYREIHNKDLSKLLLPSVGQLEVLTLSASGFGGVEFEQLVMQLGPTLLALGIDATEDTGVDEDLYRRILPTCTALQHLTITGFPNSLFSIFPPTLQRLQFNISSQPINNLMDQGEEFILTAVEAVKKLPCLRTIFHHGRHLSYSRNAAIAKTIPVVFEEWHVRYPELQAVCGDYNVALENGINFDNDKWTRFYEYH